MTKKTKLPKTILGVKIPKTLRKADWVNDILQSDAGRRLLADTLVAAAGAAAAAIVAYRPSPVEIAETGIKSIGKAGSKTRRATAKLADTILELIPGQNDEGGNGGARTKAPRSPARARKARTSPAKA